MPLFLEKRAFRNLMSICGIASAATHAMPLGVDDSVQKQRTPEEVKARRKAYKRRKAATAARRRNRK